MDIMFVAENFVVDSITEPSLYDWGKDYGIPLLGAIAVPMLVWWLTWFYGAERAEKQKELEKNKANLNYLISISLHTIRHLLNIHRLLEQKECAASLYAMLGIEAKQELMLQISFDEFMSDVEVERYAYLTLIKSSFVADLLQVKRLLKGEVATLSRINALLSEELNKKKLYLLIKNLQLLLRKINETIKLLLDLLNNLEEIKRDLNINGIIDTELSQYEKNQIEIICVDLPMDELLSYFKDKDQAKKIFENFNPFEENQVALKKSILSMIEQSKNLKK